MPAPSSFALDGRVAVVTGGSTGIGLGIALSLARAGANVTIAARRAELVADACAQVENAGVKALGVPTDVTKRPELERLVQQTRHTFGHIDILVNNAGASFGEGFNRGPLLELKEQDFDGVMALNVKSIFLLSNLVVPIMQAQEKGCIVNISSTGGLPTSPPGVGFALYGAAKAACISLTRSMAVEFGPHVRVNALAPGVVDTPRVSANRSPERAAAQVRGIVLERMGVPEDIGDAAVYLASDAAAWVTGSVLEVHGGLRAQQPPVPTGG